MRLVGLYSVMLSFFLLGGCGSERSAVETGQGCVYEGDVEWGCRDGMDNDEDGYVDCEDVADCGNHPDCGGTCEDSDTGPGGSNVDTGASDPLETGVDFLLSFGVTVFPPQPTPDDDLECRLDLSGQASSSTDPDSPPPVPTYSFRWQVASADGSPRVYDHTGPKLPSGHTGLGDAWSCHVTRYLDGVQEGDEEAAAPVNVLVNHPPSSPELKITVQENGDLLCLILTPSEDDLGAPVRYSYAWMVFDGSTTAQRSEAGPLVAADQTTTSPGLSWICLVTPSDGINVGEPGESRHEVPEGECVFSADGAQGYQFCSTPLSQQVAQASCEGFGMDLVTVGNAAENTWVSDKAGLLFENFGAFFQRYWIGLEGEASTGGWYRSGELEASYLGSALNSQASSSDCGVTGEIFGENAGEWQGAPCTELHGYVCEDRSYLVDSGDVALDGNAPVDSAALTDYGWIAPYNGNDQVLSYTSVCSRGEVGLGMKTYRSGGQDTGVSVVLDQLQSDVSTEVWAKPQDTVPMAALTVVGRDSSGALLEVSLTTIADGEFECVVGSGSMGLPSGINYVTGNDWYRFLIEIRSDGTVRCQVSLEDGTAREVSMSVPLGASFDTVEIHSLVAPMEYGTHTYWDDFKVGW